MASIHRRGFLSASAASLAGFAVARPLAGVAHGRIDPIPRARPGHLKVSLAAYSFRDYLTARDGKPPRMDLFGFVDFAADQRIDAVELTSYYFPPDVTPAYLHRLKQHAFTLGLDISGTSVRNDFCLPPGPKRDETMATVRTWVDHAAELDAPVIRIFAGTVPKGEEEGPAVARAIEGIRASLPYAIERGVTLAVENHGGITATPEQLLRIVRGVDSPNFGVNLDTFNFRGDDPYADLAQLAPYAVNVQVKTEIGPKGKPKGEVDYGRIVGLLRDARYSGYVAIEYEAQADPMVAVPVALRQLRAAIG